MPSGTRPIINLDQVPTDSHHIRHAPLAQQHDDGLDSPERDEDGASIAAPAVQPPLLASDNVRALNAAKRAKGKARASGAGGKGGAGVNAKIAAGDGAHHNDDSDDSSIGDPDALIHTLPAEVLMRVLAYLDPDSILSCTLVCRSFSELARDEATWRLAFSIAFDIEADDLELSEAAPAPAGATALRRVNRTSWKLEYAKRSELLRRWRKSRSPTVLSDPRIAAVHSIAIAHPHHFMLSASLVYGVASRSDPFTGKVSKGFIDAAGQINGAGIGNPNAEFAPDATAVAIEADASRIVWGFRGGEVNMTTLSRQGTNPRGMIKSTRFSPRGGHPGGVTDIALPFPTGQGGVHSSGRSTEKVRARQAALGDVGETFVTAGVDGTVRLWSPKRPLPLWVDTVRPPAPPDADPAIHAARNRPPPVACVVYDVGSGSVAAGTSEGSVVTWSGIDVTALLGLPVDVWDASSALVPDPAPNVLKARADHARILAAIRRADIGAPERLKVEQDPAVVQLEIDADVRRPSSLEGLAKPLANTPSHLTLLARHVGFSSFQRHDVTWPAQGDPGVVRTTTFEAPGHANEISSLRVDFDTTLPAETLSRDPSQPPSRLSPRLSAQLDVDGSPLGGAPSVLSLSGGQTRATAAPGPAVLTERKYVCAGTRLGGLYLWDWHAGSVTGDQVPTAEEASIAPMITFEGHTTAVTAIDTAAHVLVAGFSDGTVKAFCSLTGRLIRTLNDRTATRHPARMLAAGQLTADEAARFTVTQVIVREDSLIAAIGHQVLAWKAEVLRPKGRKSKEKGAGQRTPNSIRNWDSKFQARVDLRQDLNDVSVQLEDDRERRQAAYDQLKRTVGGGSGETGGLTEDEQLEYAIMLSRDAEAERARRGSATATGKGKGRETSTLDDEAELEQALVQIALAETSTESGSAAISSRSSAVEEEDDLYADDDGYDQSLDMASPSPSPGPSPSLRGVSSPSRAWDIIRNAGPHGATWNAADDRFRPNSKVRTVKVSRAARLSSSLQSGSGTVSGNENGAPTPPGLDSAAQWPEFSPSSQSPGPEAWNLDAPGAKARSQWSRSPSLHPLGGGAGSLSGIAAIGTSPSSGSVGQSRPMGAWAAGSPSSRSAARTPPRNVPGSNTASATATATTTTTPGSLLSSSRPGGALHHHGSREGTQTTSGFSIGSPGAGGSHATLAAAAVAASGDEMDADLRFAIELSLAEERSRLESQGKDSSGGRPSG